MRVSERVLADEDEPTGAQLAVIDDQLPVPAHLAGDDEATWLWRHYGTMLAQAGVIEVSDALALEGLVEAEVLARRSMRAMEAEREAQTKLAGADGALLGEGVVVTGTTGAMVTHPAYRTWRDSRAVFLRYAEHLGLTPVARTRLGVLGLAGAKLRADLEAKLPKNPRDRGS